VTDWLRWYTALSKFERTRYPYHCFEQNITAESFQRQRHIKHEINSFLRGPDKEQSYRASIFNNTWSFWEDFSIDWL